MGIQLDISGKTYGLLTAISREPRGRWLCKCACGNTCVTQTGNLNSGNSGSCGCRQRTPRPTHGHASGGSISKEYRSWQDMIQRCYNPKNVHFDRYGLRGIAVCDRWKNSFVNFIKDVGVRPHPNLQIERINNDGNYEPGNVKWATRIEQMANRSYTSYVNLNGKTMTLSEACRRADISRDDVRWIERHGSTLEIAMLFVRERLKNPGLAPMQFFGKTPRRAFQAIGETRNNENVD